MSGRSWQMQLRQTLSRLPAGDRPPHVAVVSIGHELRGDDFAGVALSRALRDLSAGRDDLLVIEGGPAPENVTGALRRFAPDLVVLIDAAQMDALPGAIRLLDWQAIQAGAPTTHSLSLRQFAAYLVAELGCEVAVLGIQPADVSFGAPLSQPVREMLKPAASALATALRAPLPVEKSPAALMPAGNWRLAMSFKVMPKTAVTEWVDRLCARYRMIGPRPLADQTVFDEIHSAAEVDLSYATTILPPKKVLLPQREVMARFTTDGATVEPVFDEQPTIVLGVHTCDLHAIALLDRVFGQGYADQHYLARRENTTLVSIECLAPCSEYSFCKSMGTLTVPDAFDLHLTDLGTNYAVDVGSEKGAALLEGFDGARAANGDDFRRVNQVMGEKWPCFPYRLEFDASELPSLLSISARSVLWDELGERCLGCAMCTNVCPTCYCFNVVDDVGLALNEGQRYRIWDSCQLDQFATVAGGHNFRESRAARLRHRFFRKGKFQTDTFGLVGCVGCGRCARACLVHISPVETFNDLYRRHANVRKQQEVVP